MKRGAIIAALIVGALIVVTVFFVKDKKNDNHSADRMKKVRAAKPKKARERAAMLQPEMKIAV